jgi:hypothetical protein
MLFVLLVLLERHFRISLEEVETSNRGRETPISMSKNRLADYWDHLTRNLFERQVCSPSLIVLYELETCGRSYAQR